MGPRPSQDLLHAGLRALTRMARAAGGGAVPVADADLVPAAGLPGWCDPGAVLDALAASGAVSVDTAPRASGEGADLLTVWAAEHPEDPERGWEAARTVAREVRRGGGGTVTVVAARLGLERPEAERAVDVLVHAECLERTGPVVPGSPPRVRPGPAPLDVLAPLSALCAAGLPGAALAAASDDGALDPAPLAAAHGVAAAQVRDALVAAALLGALRVDPRSWARGAEARHLHVRSGAPAGAEVAPAAGGPPGGTLNAAQTAAVVSPARRLVVVAGPGTGKTRTLTHRIAHRVLGGAVEGAHVLAVTFTTDATDEMRTRLAALGVRGVRVSTLNALGHRIVRDHFRAAGFTSPPEVVPTPQAVALVRELLGADPGGGDLDPVAVHTALVRAKVERMTPGALAALKDPGFRCPDPAVTARVWRLYQQRLRDAALVDYADQLALAVAVLGRPGRAAAVRAEVDEVFVDEFQDLSPVQVSLVTRLADGRGLTVVGDPRQAIYEWNGASPEALRALSRRPGVETHHLDLNYRSTEPILRAANTLAAETGLPPVRPATPSGGPPVRGRAAADATGAVAEVTRLVRAHREAGIADDGIAVLVRLNDELRTVRRGLGEAGVPVRASDLVGLHRTAAFRLAQRLLTPERVAAAGGLAAALTGAGGGSGDPPEALLTSAEEPDEARADWGRLLAALDEAERGGVDDPRRALALIAAREREEDRGDADGGVVLTTMHRAKGREWDAVVIACLDARALDTRQAEERRVAYVALTRARRHLDVVSVGGGRLLLDEAGIVIAGGRPRTREGGEDGRGGRRRRTRARR